MSDGVNRVGIIGAGYVGLTLAAHLLRNTSFEVLLVESDEKTAKNLMGGMIHVYEPGIKEIICSALQDSRLRVSDRLPRLNYRSVFICVGTPKESLGNPVEQYVEDNIQALQFTDIIFIRSTVQIGTTDTLNTKFASTHMNKFHSCPERTVEGDAIREISSLPQLLGSANELSSLEATSALASMGFKKIVHAKPREVETAKLICNIWRDYTFAFSNELVQTSQYLSVDPSKVIEIASSGYPRAPIPRPGPVGGPCLTKDSYIFHKSLNRHSLYLEARKTNESLDNFVLDECVELITESNFQKVCIAGLAFKGKPATNDSRGSIGIKLIETIEKLGIEITYWDPLIELANYMRVKTVHDLERLLDTKLLLIAANDSTQIYNELSKLESIPHESRNRLYLYDLVGIFGENFDKTRVVGLGRGKN